LYSLYDTVYAYCTIANPDILKAGNYNVSAP